MANPIAVVVTDSNGKALTITGATTGSHLEQPLPVVLSDSNGNALNLAGSVGGGAWGTITGTLSAQTDLQAALDLKAPLASPALSGNPTAPTQAALNSSTRVATTAYADSAVAVEAARAAAAEALLAPLASPALTGTPTAPTAAAATNTTQLATTAFVTAAVAALPASGWSAINARRHGSVSAGGGDLATTGGISNGSGVGDAFDASAVNTAFVAPTSTAGPATKFGSASTATTAGIHSHNNIWRMGKNIASRYIGYLTRVTDIRFWYGLTDQTLATMTASDNPAGNYAAFRFSATGGDSLYQCITKDGTTQTITSVTGVAPVAGTSDNLAIVIDDTNGNVKFYINGVLKATHSTHLPAAGTNMAAFAGSQWVSTQTFNNITAIDTEADY